MKNTLKLLLVGILAASPALAVEYDGGNLVLDSTFPAGKRTTLSHVRPAGTAVDYSNVTTFLGSTVLNGGSALQGTNTITRMTMDDLTPTGTNAGQDVLQFKFSVVNLNTVPVNCRPRVRFWNADGAGGNPGSYYSVPVAVGFSFNPFNFGANSATVLTANLPANQFKMPGATFWAGLTFDNFNGTTGATAAQLDNLGQGLFDPVDVGSSQDTYFHTTAAGSFFNVANPAGAQGNFMGMPVANMGWEFSADLVVGTEDTNWTTIKALFR